MLAQSGISESLTPYVQRVEFLMKAERRQGSGEDSAAAAVKCAADLSIWERTHLNESCDQNTHTPQSLSSNRIRSIGDCLALGHQQK